MCERLFRQVIVYFVVEHRLIELLSGMAIAFSSNSEWSSRGQKGKKDPVGPTQIVRQMTYEFCPITILSTAATITANADGETADGEKKCATHSLKAQRKCTHKNKENGSFQAMCILCAHCACV